MGLIYDCMSKLAMYSTSNSEYFLCQLECQSHDRVRYAVAVQKVPLQLIVLLQKRLANV